jgi:hypothetical protein
LALLSSPSPNRTFRAIRASLAVRLQAGQT